MAAGRVVLLCSVFAALLRWGIYYSRLHKFFYDRPEIATPANSFKRALEGLALWEAGLSPYAGGACHHVPGLLYLFSLLRSLPSPCLTLLFTLTDLWTAFCLGKAGELFLRRLHKERREHKARGWVEEEALAPNEPGRARALITLACLFNPFSVLSCVTLTSTVVQNAVLATSLLCVLRGGVLSSALCLALAGHNELYALLLVVPTALCLAREGHRLAAWTLALTSLALWAALGLATTAAMGGSWEWAQASYGFHLSVPDLSPNVGLFWYFFTEMFQHFRLFFLAVFQLNILVYVVPLGLLLRSSPVMLWLEVVLLVAVFKPYPCVGDSVLHLCLLPALSHLYPHLRHSLVVGATLVVTAVLGPVMWFLWIHAGSANANFYFAVTLAYSTAQIFLATDLLYAHLKHPVLARFGSKPTIGGKDAKFYLQK